MFDISWVFIVWSPVVLVMVTILVFIFFERQEAILFTGLAALGVGLLGVIGLSLARSQGLEPAFNVNIVEGQKLGIDWYLAMQLSIVTYQSILLMFGGLAIAMVAIMMRLVAHFRRPRRAV
jgi:hypothetical protein